MQSGRTWEALRGAVPLRSAALRGEHIDRVVVGRRPVKPRGPRGACYATGKLKDLCSACECVPKVRRKESTTGKSSKSHAL